MKKALILNGLILALLIVCIAPNIHTDNTDAATNTVIQDGAQYTLYANGTAELTKFTNNLPAELVIPQSIEQDGENYHVVAIKVQFPRTNNTVKSIVLESNQGLILYRNMFQGAKIETCTIGENIDLVNNMFNACTKLTKVQLPESIKAIPNGAFGGCTALAEIKLGEQITNIGMNAFNNCKSLPELKLPESLTSIGNNAFRNCTGLKELYIGPNVKTIGSNAFNGLDLSIVKLYMTSISMGEQCFLDDFDVISIPEDNTAYTTENGILYNKDKTELVYFPRKTTTADDTFTTSANIGPYAFYGTKVSKITIKDGAKTIGEYAFYNSSVKEISIAETVEEIGQYAFAGTPGTTTPLTTINLPHNLKTISEFLFRNSSISLIIIGEGTESIGNSAFTGCMDLQKVIINGNLKKIGDNAFSDCTNLSEINLPESITSIGAHAFSTSYIGSYGLEKLILTKLPANLEYLGDCAFSGDTKVTLSKLPDSLTHIGAYALYNTGIERIIVGETKQIEIGSDTITTIYAFGGPALRSIELNNVAVVNQMYCGTIVRNLPTLESYTLGSDFKLWEWDENGMGFNKETKTAYLLKNTVKNFVIPSTVDKLSGTGFQQLQIETIDYEGPQSRTITFETQESTTNERVFFRSCTKLVSIRLPNVISINGALNFGIDNSALEEINIAGIDSFTLPNYKSSLTKISLGECSKLTLTTNAYYFKFPSNLTSLNKTDILYDSSGNKININKDSIQSIAGKTFVWNGTYLDTYDVNLIEVTSGQSVICLDYGQSKAYIAATNGSTVDLTKYVHKDYSVEKWYIDPEKTKEFDDSTVINGPMTLYAELSTPTLYTVTKAGEEPFILKYLNEEVEKDVQVPADSDIIVNSAKKGYSVTTYINGIEDKSILIKIKEDSEISVKYTPYKVTLAFDTDGGNTIDNITGTIGETYTKPTNPIKEGYTFIKWIPELSDTLPISSRNNQTITYTAIWAPNTITISFDTDGGESLDPVGRLYKTTIGYLPSAMKEGYTFTGWYTAEGEEPITYEWAVRTTKNIMLYAHWTINQYTVSFDTDGGTEIKSVTQDYGSAIETPVDPTKEGYLFLGWSPEIPKTTPAQDIQVTAIWAPVIIPDEEGIAKIELNNQDTFVISNAETKMIDITISDNSAIRIENASDLSGRTIVSKIDAIANTSSIEGVAYDLTFTADGQQYSGKMLVTLPYVKIDGKEAVVYYWDGIESTKMNITEQGETFVTFETDHNSTYIIASEDSADDDNTVYLAAVAIVILAIIAGLFAVRWSRKNA